MSKRGRMVVVMMAVLIQVMLGVLYGFSDVPVSSCGCFIIWCVCAAMICRFVGAPETI